MIEFHLDSRSGVSPYQQLVRQVRHALRLGLLREGDQLPVADLERACDYLIVLDAGRVLLVGEIDDLLASHRRLSGPRRDLGTLPADQHVVTASHTDRQTTVLVRTDAPILDPVWTVSEVGLEDLVLAYLTGPADPAGSPRPTLAVRR